MEELDETRTHEVRKLARWANSQIAEVKPAAATQSPQFSAIAADRKSAKDDA